MTKQGRSAEGQRNISDFTSITAPFGMRLASPAQHAALRQHTREDQSYVEVGMIIAVGRRSQHTWQKGRIGCGEQCRWKPRRGLSDLATRACSARVGNQQ